MHHTNTRSRRLGDLRDRRMPAQESMGPPRGFTAPACTGSAGAGDFFHEGSQCGALFAC